MVHLIGDKAREPFSGVFKNRDKGLAMKKVLTTAVAILAATAASAASFNKVEVGSETVAYYDLSLIHI